MGKPTKLRKKDVEALEKLRRYGELIHVPSRVHAGWFGNVLGPRMVDGDSVDRLAAHGLARVDHVGQSRFAVYTGGEA